MSGMWSSYIAAPDAHLNVSEVHLETDDFAKCRDALRMAKFWALMAKFDCAEERKKTA